TVALAEPAEGSRAPASALAGDAPVAPDHAGAAGAFTGVVREDPLNASRGSFVRDIAPRDADFRGLAHEKFSDDAIGSVMQSAIAEQEMTIFRQVSRRYRAVTPM